MPRQLSPKALAEAAVESALFEGTLKEPTACAVKNHTSTGVHYVHYWGYEQEHHLHVLPLCMRHDSESKGPSECWDRHKLEIARTIGVMLDDQEHLPEYWNSLRKD